MHHTMHVLDAPEGLSLDVGNCSFKSCISYY